MTVLLNIECTDKAENTLNSFGDDIRLHRLPEGIELKRGGSVEVK